MTPGCFRFGPFLLDPANRRLARDGAPVDLNGRYFDALTLLVGEAGRLVSKDSFMDSVWRGVPVTDEALTQCVKTLRRTLGDEATRPRFIETVPKHGYRFIGEVERIGAPEAAPPAQHGNARRLFQLGAAGTIGGGIAGLIGGLVYGFAAAAQPLAPGMGAASVLLVLMCLTILAALIGGAGVSFGIAAAEILSRRGSAWTIAGGAAGGMIVGASAKLLGLDAFNLLLGQSPGDITGAAEGVLLGGGVGIGTWLVDRRPISARRAAAVAGACGAAGGMMAIALGGRLMAGSLDLLAASFPESRLRLDQIGALFGERGFGPVSALATGAIEGLLFGVCLVGAMAIARRSIRP